MATPARYDTTCPNCNQTFEVEETLSEGNCPFCNVHLRFLEEAPPPPPGMPEWAPEPVSPPSTAPASNGDGGFGVSCPRCSHSFSVAVDATTGACPSCHVDLVFENHYAHTPDAYTVRCPSCGATSDVAPDATSMDCRHCGSALKVENVYPGQEALLEIGPRTQAPASPEPQRPSEEPVAPSEPSVAQAKAKRGLFRRFTPSSKPASPPEPEPVVETPEPPPTLPGRPPPVVSAPPTGLPYVLSCPTCKKEFSVTPKEREGNCPHCNASLAFLSEKEYDALLDAEQRKKEFQAKLQQRRLERKKRDEERLAREATGAPTPNLIKRFLPGKKAEASPSPTAGTPAAEPKPEEKPTPSAAAPETGAKRRLRLPWESKKAARAETTAAMPVLEPPPEAAVEATEPSPSKRGRKKDTAAAEPATVELASTAPVEVAASPEPTPRKGLLGRFKNTKTEPQPPAAFAMEAPTEITDAEISPPKKGRAKKTSAPTPAPTAAIELETAPMEIAASPPPPTAPKKGLLGRFKKTTKEAPPTPASVEPVQVDFEAAPVEVATSATEPPAAPKKKLLGRFGGKKAPPAPAAPAATVESIDFGDVSTAASVPSPVEKAPKSKKTKAAPAAPVEAAAAIELESNLEVAAAAPAPKKRGLFSRFKQKKAAPGPSAVVESGDIDIANGAGPAAVDVGQIDVSGTVEAAPRRKRK